MMSVSNQAAIDLRAMESRPSTFALDPTDEGFGESPNILIVDPSELNRHLLKAMLKTASYSIIESTHPAEAFELLERRKIDLVIADFLMPGMSGPDFCRVVKGNRKTRLTPILLVTSLQGSENEIAGIDSGADEFLVKPLKPALVRTRIRGLLRNKALTDSLDEAETILFALAQSVEQRDKYTGKHCERLALYSVMLGKAMNLSRRDQLTLYRGGFLHDIGKVGIPDSILFKHRRLTEDEWQVMRMHTIRGEEICRPMKTLAPVLPIIRSHHERWNGSGYPDGLHGEEIPLLARILQIADIYDALTTTRPYKPAYSHQHAVEVMSEETRRGWRDPELVALFAEVTRTGASDGPALPSGDAGMRRSLDAMRLELMK